MPDLKHTEWKGPDTSSPSNNSGEMETEDQQKGCEALRIKTNVCCCCLSFDYHVVWLQVQQEWYFEQGEMIAVIHTNKEFIAVYRRGPNAATLRKVILKEQSWSVLSCT